MGAAIDHAQIILSVPIKLSITFTNCPSRALIAANLCAFLLSVLLFRSGLVGVSSNWVAESSDMNPALQFLARFLSATVQVLSKSDSTCASLKMVRISSVRLKHTGDLPCNSSQVYINPSPKSHNPPRPLISSLSIIFLERNIDKNLRRTAGNPFTLLLRTRDYLGDVSCKAPWQSFTAFEAGSALPQRPRNVPGWPPAGFLTGQAA